MSTPAQRRYVALDEINPTVDLASFWQVGKVWYKYRIPGHHLLLIEKGQAEARTPNGTLRAKAGDLLCFQPCEQNEYGAQGGLRFYQAHINFGPTPQDRLTPWLDERGPLPEKLALGENFEALRRAFESLCMELSRPGAEHRLRLRATVFEMLALVASAMSGRPAAPARLDSWQRVRLRLASDLAQDVRIGRLAQEMGCSADHFIRRFKQRFGFSPRHYRMRARLTEAARLLREGGVTIKFVSFKLGFSDPKAFTRAFKRRMGVTPAELRASAERLVAKRLPLEGRLYPVNQHVVPPHAGADWFEKWRAR